MEVGMCFLCMKRVNVDNYEMEVCVRVCVCV